MPLQRCSADGKSGWKWGKSGKCYTGPRGRSRAIRQMQAIKASGWTENVSTSPGPLRRDPTRTQFLRLRLRREIVKRLRKLWVAVKAKLTSQQNVLVANAEQEEIDEFERWLLLAIGYLLLTADQWWAVPIASAYAKGVERAFERLGAPPGAAPWEAATKQQFVQTVLRRQAERLKLLEGTTFTSLNGLTDRLRTGVLQELHAGFLAGKTPVEIAGSIQDKFDIAFSDANRIARTEIVRGYNEGLLDALEALGETQVEVEVEWVNGPRPCPKCLAKAGTILKVSESHGLIPLHPYCMCSFVPVRRRR